MASLNSARVKSRNSSYEAQVTEYEKAFDLLWSDNGSYPLVPGLVCLGTGYTGGNCGTWINGAGGTMRTENAAFNTTVSAYLPSLPIPGHVDTSINRQGALYTQLNSGQGFRIWYVLEGNTTCSNGTTVTASAVRTICRLDR